jgi:hypothetical protein
MLLRAPKRCAAISIMLNSKRFGHLSFEFV